MEDLGAPLEPSDINGFITNENVHVQPVRVYYEDTDASGIVYHANYVRYIERGRTNFLRLMGVHHQDLMALPEPIAFTVTRVEMDFVLPARLDDTLEVHTRYTKVTGVRIYGSQIVKRDGIELIRAQIEAACINLEGKPRRLPKVIRNAMAHYLAEESA